MECPRETNFFEARAVHKGKFLYFFDLCVRKVNILEQVQLSQTIRWQWIVTAARLGRDSLAAFKRLVKLPGRHKWRGVYAEENAFAICPDMRWPPWLHMVPDTGYVSGLA